MLNLPNALVGGYKPKHVLLAAIGGGFDVFNATPLMHTLACNDIQWTISSYSVDSSFRAGEFVPVTGFTQGDTYNPEGILASFLNTPSIYDRGPREQRTIYKIGKVGPRPLAAAYKKLIEQLGIDCIIMMDGGVDSLTVGNEVRKGTCTEEYVNFAALDDNPTRKYLMSFGFGCEVEEEISHYRILENMSRLFAENDFVGACALTRDEAGFANYNCAYQYVIDHFPEHKRSHIHPRIISAIKGEFGFQSLSDGNTIMKSVKPVFISPLMAVMWFFDGNAVIRNNQLVPMMKNFSTFMEAVGLVRMAPSVRDYQTIPY